MNERTSWLNPTQSLEICRKRKNKTIALTSVTHWPCVYDLHFPGYFIVIAFDVRILGLFMSISCIGAIAVSRENRVEVGRYFGTCTLPTRCDLLY